MGTWRALHQNQGRGGWWAKTIKAGPPGLTASCLGCCLTAPGVTPSGVGSAGQRPERGLDLAEKLGENSCKTVSKRTEVDAAGLGNSVKSKTAQKENTGILSVLTKRRTGLPKTSTAPGWLQLPKGHQEGQVKGPEPTRDHPPHVHAWVPGTEREPRHGPWAQGAYDQDPTLPHSSEVSDVLWATWLLGGGPGTPFSDLPSPPSVEPQAPGQPFVPCLRDLP